MMMMMIWVVRHGHWLERCDTRFVGYVVPFCPHDLARVEDEAVSVRRAVRRAD